MSNSPSAVEKTQRQLSRDVKEDKTFSINAIYELPATKLNLPRVQAERGQEGFEKAPLKIDGCDQTRRVRRS